MKKILLPLLGLLAFPLAAVADPPDLPGIPNAAEEKATTQHVTCSSLPEKNIEETGDKTFDSGDYAAAEKAYDCALSKMLEKNGDSLEVASLYNKLSMVYAHLKRYESGKQAVEKALKIREAQLGPTHLDVATSLNNLAYLHSEEKQYVEAELLYERALAIRQHHLTHDDPLVSQSLHNLAYVYMKEKKYAMAEPMLRRSLAIDEVHYGASHPVVLHRLKSLAELYRETHRMEQAEEIEARIREAAPAS